jgi:ribosomal protein S4E
MDVLTLTKTNESYRLLYDVKGRFTLLKLKDG